MPEAVVFTWPAASATAIAAAQTLAGAGTIKLNGSLAAPVYNGLYVPLLNQQRVITLTTSGHDDSGTNVIIAGTLNGAVVEQVIAGPDNATVATTQLYDSVTSVTTNGAVTAMSVGTGTTGFTNYFTYSYLQPYAALTCAVVVASTIEYTLQVTLDDVQTNASPTFFNPVMAMSGASTTLLEAVTPLPIRYANIEIVSASGGSLVATFLQQGVSV